MRLLTMIGSLISITVVISALLLLMLVVQELLR
jgi:hypothetical protein